MRADDDEVDDDLDEAPRLEHERPPERRLRPLRDAAARALLEVAQEAAELNEQHEGDEHAEGGQPPVVEHVVGERRRADRSRDEREQEHRPRLRQPVVHEPVRRVVASSLCHRPPLREPLQRDERRVEDRDREDEEREEDRRDRRPGHRPARREREGGEPEPEHLAPRVAHEHRRAAPRAQVEREEPRAREAEREREDEHRLVLVLRQRVDREVRARDRGQRRREPVHVVEQVEGVRDPDEPEEADRPRQDVVLDDLDAQAAREHDHGGADLRGQLGEGAQVTEVVDEPGREEEREPREDARRARCSTRPRRPRARGRRRPRSPRRCRLHRRSGSPARASAPPSGPRRGARPARERRSAQRTATVTGNAAIATIASTAWKG